MVYDHLAGGAENGFLVVGFDVGDLFGEAENGSLAEVIDFRDLGGENCLRSVLQLTRVY